MSQNAVASGMWHRTRQGSTGRRSVRAFYITLVMVLASAAPVRGQFGAYPVIMDFNPGEPEVEVLTLLSESDEPIVLRLYLGDFDQYPEGNHQWGGYGQHPRSCHGRASVFPESAELEPGAMLPVRVTMEPGETTCWSAVFVERVVPDGAYRVAQRIAVKVHGHAAVPRVAANVVDVHVQAEGDSLAAIVTMDNTGNTNLRPEGDLEVRSMDGAVVRTLPIAPFSTLPGHRRVVRVPLPADLPAGELLAIPILDIGQDYLLGGQASFEATIGSRR